MGNSSGSLEHANERGCLGRGGWYRGLPSYLPTPPIVEPWKVRLLPGKMLHHDGIERVRIHVLPGARAAVVADIRRATSVRTEHPRSPYRRRIMNGRRPAFASSSGKISKPRASSILQTRDAYGNVSAS